MALGLSVLGVNASAREIDNRPLYYAMLQGLETNFEPYLEELLKVPIHIYTDRQNDASKYQRLKFGRIRHRNSLLLPSIQ